MNRIAERAGALGLFVTANTLADAKIDPDSATRDARLGEAVAGDIKRILGQMVRRGGDPELVRAVWAKLEGRPLERALVAVDVLAQSLWAQRDPLLAEMRDAAATLGAARPKPGEVGIDLNAHTARGLIEQHARQPQLANATIVELFAQAYEQHLGALDELLRREDDLVARQATRESIHAFARLAALAHLPTLASVYFDWLVRGLGWRTPALDLCETLFDAGAAPKIPGTAIQPGDVPADEERDVAEYLAYRAQLAVGDTDSAYAFLMQNMNRRPRWIGPPALRVDVVRAHLGALYDDAAVKLSRVEAACVDDTLWRYAAKVRAIVAASRTPQRALELFNAYLGGFGNDLDTTLTVVSLVPEAVKRDVARIICREAFYLPHEPAPWKLLGVLGGFGEPITDEIDARLRAQSA